MKKEENNKIAENISYSQLLIINQKQTVVIKILLHININKQLLL